MHYYIEPEVSGSIGEKSIIDNTSYPPLVKRLNYEFDGWLGDDIIESFPCFVVSEKLKIELEEHSLSGFSLDDVEITKSEKFTDLHPNKDLPTFYWLKISGKAGKDDFGIAEDFRLVISEKTLSIFKKNKIDHADIEKFQ